MSLENRRLTILGIVKHKRSRIILILFLLLGIISSSWLIASSAAPPAPVNLTIPYTPSGVATADLDGNPATGNWADAVSAVVPMENGDPGQYGTTTAYLKHDGVNIYVRLDGKIDVPWASATGDHFWIGWMISPSAITGHHRASGQDYVFFGETSYPSIAYPLTPVEAHGGSTKPPAKDSQQDVVGMARYTGTSVPYSFTAEWKRALNTGDAADIVLQADGSTLYNFYVTTESSGAGSGGTGSISHGVVTNTNTFKLAPVPAGTHDVGVTGLTTSVTSVTVGDTITITVTVMNKGSFDETVTVHALSDSTDVGSTIGPVLKGTEARFDIHWNTAGTPDGTHTMTGTVDPVPGDTNTGDKRFVDGTVVLAPVGAIHDVAVTSVQPSSNTFTAGATLNVTVTVQNLGTADEAVNVHAFYGTTKIGTTNGVVSKGLSKAFVIQWSTAGLTAGTYTLKGSVDPVTGETNTVDNSLTGGQVTVSAGQATLVKPNKDAAWSMTLVALLSVTVSLLGVAYLFIGRRLRS